MIRQKKKYESLDGRGLGNYGDIKPVGSGISELRIDYGPGYRIYIWQRNQEMILIINAGHKSTQEKDIAKAKIILKEIGDNYE